VAAGLQIDPNNAECINLEGTCINNKGPGLTMPEDPLKTGTFTLKPNYSQLIGKLATINFSQGMLGLARHRRHAHILLL